MKILGSPFFKKLGLYTTITGVLILIFHLIVKPSYEQAGSFNRINYNLHYIIIFGLIMLTYSKEKIDDERVHQIRYYVTMFCLRLIMAVIPVYVLLTGLDRVDFSISVILYMIEANLILFQILFRIGLEKNPDFIFKRDNEHKENVGFTIIFIALIILTVTSLIEIMGNM